MAVLYAVLAARDATRGTAGAEAGDGAVERTAKGLLAHLSLLFVPAGVGVLQSLDVIMAHGLGLAVALLASTLLALLATALSFVAAARLLGEGPETGR